MSLSWEVCKTPDIVEKTKEPKVKSREGQATGINNKST